MHKGWARYASNSSGSASRCSVHEGESQRPLHGSERKRVADSRASAFACVDAQLRPGYALGTSSCPRPHAVVSQHSTDSCCHILVTGFIDQTLINIGADDDGGEMDPHGADQVRRASTRVQSASRELTFPRSEETLLEVFSSPSRSVLLPGTARPTARRSSKSSNGTSESPARSARTTRMR